MELSTAVAIIIHQLWKHAHAIQLGVLYFKGPLQFSEFSTACQHKAPQRSHVLFQHKCKILMELKENTALGYSCVVCSRNLLSSRLRSSILIRRTIEEETRFLTFSTLLLSWKLNLYTPFQAKFLLSIPGCISCPEYGFLSRCCPWHFFPLYFYRPSRQ